MLSLLVCSRLCCCCPTSSSFDFEEENSECFWLLLLSLDSLSLPLRSGRQTFSFLCFATIFQPVISPLPRNETLFGECLYRNFSILKDSLVGRKGFRLALLCHVECHANRKAEGGRMENRNNIECNERLFRNRKQNLEKKQFSEKTCHFSGEDIVDTRT